MECQCAGCYPEREARRKHREKMARIDKLRELLDCTLPLEHYYVYNGVVVHAGYEWITRYIADIRQACIEKGYRP